jgi:hypothetical protein
LLDVGLGPRKLGERLESVGSSWDQVRVALLTHTHGDHVDSDTLAQLAKRGIPLYRHEGHHKALARHAGYRPLVQAKLVRAYDARPFLLPNGIRVEPISLPHGVGPTFGFRIEARPLRARRWVAMGYLADLGHWTSAMADTLADVSLLAIEFNHDVEMQWGSGRPPALIARNVGKQGHLSNNQGADFMAAVLERSAQVSLKHVVLLHLSELCNHPALALATARAALRLSGRRAKIHTTAYGSAAPDLLLQTDRRRSRAKTATTHMSQFAVPWEAA